MSDKPDCYTCKYRRDLLGDAHSQCVHPAIKADGAVDEILSIFTKLPSHPEAIAELRIDAIRHGVVSGWFAWPHNFDPIWLLNCDGFTPKEDE